MIDRRGFLIGTAAAAAMPGLPTDAAAAIAPTTEAAPDAWEKRLRDIEMHIRILRESRAKIAAIETRPGLSESNRLNLQYLHSLTIDHCARITQQLALESQWDAQLTMEAYWVKSGRDTAGRIKSLPHPRDRHMRSL